MRTHTVLIDKSNFQARVESNDVEPALNAGEVLVQIDLFGLSTNNITYAVVGESLGYWAYFPSASGEGCIPVWGIATIVASESEQLAVGERLFGYFPMASHWVLTPADVRDLCFTDATEHRTALHPWYNRYYRCTNDPAYLPNEEGAQATLWALFMTGWMLARELAADPRTVVISSASSKTAVALAWSRKQAAPNQKLIGLTSPGNRDFVTSLDLYDEICVYAEVADLPAAGAMTYIDIAGDPALTSSVHVTLGDSLRDSVFVGATHRGAPADLPMPGPTPRFFFIPDVAEQHAATDGLPAYHDQFAHALSAFVEWSKQWMELNTNTGVDAITSGYAEAFAGVTSPQRAQLYAWD